jgi:hypothetical protein
LWSTPADQPSRAKLRAGIAHLYFFVSVSGWKSRNDRRI